MPAYVICYHCSRRFCADCIPFRSRCNVEPAFPSFFGLTHANMVHVSDLRVLLTPDANHTDFKTVGFYSPVSQEPFYSGLGLFELALDEWLPCFGSSRKV